jgi:hypothetical protein
VLFVVALVGAAAAAWPSLRRVAERARQERARSQTATMAAALFRFYQDNGFFPLWAQVQGSAGLRRVDLLVSAGLRPAAPAGSPWIMGGAGTLADELVSNAPSYAERGDPGETGWAGPYLPEPPGPDPWDHRYTVNVGLLSAGTPEEADTPRYAVWVLCAGPDGTIQTAYWQPIDSAALGGDDIGVRVQ